MSTDADDDDDGADNDNDERDDEPVPQADHPRQEGVESGCRERVVQLRRLCRP